MLHLLMLYVDSPDHCMWPSTTGTVAVLLCHSSEIHLQMVQFEEMRQHALRPNVYTYNALIKAECHVGNFTKVRPTFCLHSI